MYKHAVYDTTHYSTNRAISTKIGNVSSSDKVKRFEHNRRFLQLSSNYPKPMFKSMPSKLVETLPITNQLIKFNDDHRNLVKVTKVYCVKITHNINFRQSFLKIGVTPNTLHANVRYKLSDYDVRILAITKYLEGKFIDIFWQCLDKIIKKYYERSEIILSPDGNIECFKFSLEMYKEILEIMNPFLA